MHLCCSSIWMEQTESRSKSLTCFNIHMTMAAARRLGKVSLKNTALLLCDMQEKFRGNIMYYPQVIEVARRMLEGANALDMPVIVTEQYPKGGAQDLSVWVGMARGIQGAVIAHKAQMGPEHSNILHIVVSDVAHGPLVLYCSLSIQPGLGHTVSELDVSQLKVFPKTHFSMLIPEVVDHIKSLKDVNSVMICGIENHVCVQNTVLDLLEDNFDVHLIADACSSRSMTDRMYAFQRMKDAGAFVTTSESMLLALVGGASHPRFKQVQKIIMTSAPDTGLLTTVKGETAV